MKKILLVLALVLGVVPVVAFAAGDKTRTIKIMSYNVRPSDISEGTNSWAHRYPASAYMFVEHEPDVMAIQDVLDVQLKYFVDISKGYKYIGAGCEDGKKNGTQSAILYNSKTVSVSKSGTFWLSETPATPSSSWGAEKNTTATWAVMKDKNTGSKFIFVSTCLDKVSEEARKMSLSLIMDKIAEINTDNSPVVLAGDFKMRPEDPSWAVVKQSLKDTRSIAFNTDKKGTYNNWGKQKDDCIYDYIWVSGFGSCTSYETVTKEYYERAFISDHFPIKAILVFD